MSSKIVRARRCVRLNTRWARCAIVLAAIVAAGLAAQGRAADARHAIAMHGDPAWADGFDSVPYADPNAPKGGRLVQGVLGTFDSLNPFIVRGLAAQSIRGYVVESLMARGYEEPFTLYGLLARSVETDDARSFVTFTLDPDARFSDGRPVTPQDVVFSWELLRDKGRPNHRAYYSKVKKADIAGSTVRFDLGGSEDRELPLILGLMPVLARHAVDPATFEETTFDPPVGSGPYVVSDVRPGHSVTFKRDPNYWGRKLGINRGSWNFDEVRFDYYRDANSYFEAFKKGLYDVRAENDPGRWQTGYDVPAIRAGAIVKEGFPSGLPKGLTGYVFNTRRTIFTDIRVREAIGLLLLRCLHAHGQLLRRLRIGLGRPPRRCTRARIARGLSRSGASRRARWALAAACERWFWAGSRVPEEGARAVFRRGLRTRRRGLAQSQNRRAIHLRNSCDHPGPGTTRHRFLAGPQARRHRRQGPHGGRGSVRPAQAHI
jgi:ABC-type transport system substrate-binding protein